MQCSGVGTALRQSASGQFSGDSGTDDCRNVFCAGAKSAFLTAAVEGDWTSARQRANQVLASLDLEHVADDLAETLSGGQRRLLEFGRVTMRDRRVILLDEVTAGVNPRLRDIILGALRDLREQGKTFMVIEHDMELVRTVCERIMVMDAGGIVAEGTFDEIARNKLVVEAYLGGLTE